tara:strand:- start:2059 stop:2451 length:393 start_codon:yes stop_codon:yes gene_type:complete
MKTIFDRFVKKEISGDTLIKDAYSELHDIKTAWITDPLGLTIQEHVNKICDDLESQGYNLTMTPIEEIKIRFVLYDIKIEAPAEYIELREAKKLAEETLVAFESGGAESKYINQVSSMISLIEAKMKNLS